VEREFLTSDYGTINYDALTGTGTYEVRAIKDRYNNAKTTFEARHAFDVKFDPANPTVKDTINMMVVDQNGKPVSDVMVEIPGAGLRRVTDMGGKISFNLQEPKNYEIRLSKDLFWGKTMNLTPYGILTLGECIQEFELGESVTVTVFDSFNNPMSATIDVKDPAGIVKEIASQTYTLVPDKPGIYTVTVGSTNYVGANQTFKVNPHPVDIYTKMSSGNLIVNVSSNKKMLPLIRVSMAKDNVVFNGTTNDAGLALFEMRGVGNITVTVNPGRNNINYEEKVLREAVVRSYDLVLLTTPLVIIFIITLMTIVAIQLGRRVFGGGSWQMPTIGFGKKRMKSKHDSVLLADKKSSKNSRLSNL